jgi:hypothetical protein
MNAQVSSRVVLLVGLGFVALAGAVFFLMTSNHARTASTATPTQSTTPSTPAKTPAKIPAGPKLDPDLPAPIAFALARHRSVVVALYGRAAGDGTAIAEARAGASLAHTKFVALDMTKQRYAEAMASFGGTLAEPTVFVVKRPGTIVRRLEGFQDRQVVAQAAHDVR